MSISTRRRRTKKGVLVKELDGWPSLRRLSYRKRYLISIAFSGLAALYFDTGSGSSWPTN